MHFHLEKCDTCGAHCVQGHFPAHRAVRSDLPPDFLRSLPKPGSRLGESGSRPAAGRSMRSRLQPSAASADRILRPKRVPLPAGLDGPVSRRSNTSTRRRWGRHRGIWFQPIAPVWFGNQGHDGPLVHPEAGKLHSRSPTCSPGHPCSGASLATFFSRMAASLRDPAASSGSPGLPAVVLSTGLVLRFCSS